MSYFDMEELDLIENLQRRGIDHITEKIFGYLDYKCLKRAELVSEVWRKAILDGKLWEKLFYKNITLLPKWRKIFNALKGMKHKGLTENQRSVGYHRKWCCLVESELGLLESNWSKARYLEQNAQLEEEVHFYFMQSLRPEKIEMNGNWIVHGPYWNKIAVRNRWTLELEKILEIPKTQMEDEEDIEFHSVKVNETFIVASFKENSDLCVWDAKTKDLQMVISDDKCLRRFEGEEERIYSEGLYLFRNLILTCHYRISDENSWIFNLREIPKNLEDEVSHLYLKTIPGDPRELRDFAMDETYIVIWFSPFGFHPFIQIRKTISFEIVNSIQLDAKMTDLPLFAYHNGLIVTGREIGCIMRLWNVVTGQCVREIIAADHPLRDIRIISDKFIVTCDLAGKLKIWDLQAALKNTDQVSSSNFLLKTIAAPLYPSARFSSRWPPYPAPLRMLADEYQIVTTIEFQYNQGIIDSRFLYSQTFLGVPN